MKTHDEICDLAVKWLLRNHSANGAGCNIALKEVQVDNLKGEVADAVGFRYKGTKYDEGSILIEVKTSRQDFIKDKQKPHRIKPEIGIGKWRYFLCPEGLISPDELPEKWGLLYLNKRNSIKVIKGAMLSINNYKQSLIEFPKWEFEYNKDFEINLLTRMLSRIGDPNELNIKLREINRENQRLITKIHNMEQKRKFI